MKLQVKYKDDSNLKDNSDIGIIETIAVEYCKDKKQIVAFTADGDNFIIENVNESIYGAVVRQLYYENKCDLTDYYGKWDRE